MLLTQEEWMKRSNKGGFIGSLNQKPRGGGTGRGYTRGGGSASRGRLNRIEDSNRGN